MWDFIESSNSISSQVAVPVRARNRAASSAIAASPPMRLVVAWGSMSSVVFADARVLYIGFALSGGYLTGRARALPGKWRPGRGNRHTAETGRWVTHLPADRADFRSCRTHVKADTQGRRRAAEGVAARGQQTKCLLACLAC